MDAALFVQTIPKREHEEIDEILLNVLQKCKSEAELNRLQVPLKDIEERVAYYTGISLDKINQIQNMFAKNIRAHSIDFNFFKHILKCLHQYYDRKELPTFRDLFDKVHKLIASGKNYEEFIQDLNLWGFGYHTIFNDTILLMEDPKVTFQRYSYLKRVRQLRQEGAVFYYVSARLIDKDQNYIAPWNLNTETSKTSSGEYTFFHAISNMGLTNGLFSYTATENDFYKWVVDILLGALRASSVVILEHSPLNGKSKSNSMSIYDTKQDMQKWLRNHNVPCSNAMNKSLLYELIKKHAVVDEMSRIEYAIRASGHEVLILTPYFEDLSPIEMIWKDIKKNKFASKNIHDMILLCFEEIPKENYQIYETSVKNRENELFSLDENMDKALDAFLLDLKNPKTIIIKTEC